MRRDNREMNEVCGKVPAYIYINFNGFLSMSISKYLKQIKHGVSKTMIWLLKLEFELL